MDVPSPLIQKFLPCEISKRVSDNDILRESAFLDYMSFHVAVCVYFRSDQGVDIRRFSYGSNRGQLIIHIHDFKEIAKNKLFKLDLDQSSADELVMGPVPVRVRAEMVRLGQECCNKLIFPFAVQKPKSASYIISVASSFHHVFQRLRILWSSEEDMQSSLSTTGVIFNQLISSWENPQWLLCGQLAALALETMCLETYQFTYSTLSTAEKADADNLCTRKMFWAASFFYNLIKPGWDREVDFSQWIDEAIDTYLLEFGGDRRLGFFNSVLSAKLRAVSKFNALEHIKRRMELISPRDVNTRENLNDLATRLRGLSVEKYSPSASELLAFGDQMHDINLTLFILEDEQFEIRMEPERVRTVPQNSGGAARSVQSIIAEVDNVAASRDMQGMVDGLVDRRNAMDWVGEEEAAAVDEEIKPKKKTKNQRRRQAKEKQAAELALIMGELCDKVAKEAVIENERLALEAAKEKERLEIEAAKEKERSAIKAAKKKERSDLKAAKEAERLAIKAEREAIKTERKAIAAAKEKQRLELAAAKEKERLESEATREREVIANELLNSVVGSIAKDVVEELKSDIAARSQKDVLEQAKMGVLPTGFAQELLMSEFPAADNMLQPVVECFICMQPVDFRDPGVRYLVCCSGGSFACPDCIAIHNPPDRHPIQAERQIVMLAVSLRRKLKLGEFA